MALKFFNVMKRIYIFRILLASLSLALGIWIFSNSLTSGTASSQSSAGVTKIVQDIINAITPQESIPIKVDEAFIRKAAHFCEYALFGFLLFFTYLSFAGGSNKKRRLIIVFFSVAMVWPIIDETLQLFSEGRACSVFDVLLDMSGEAFGGLTAFGLFCLCILLFGLNKNKRNVSADKN